MKIAIISDIHSNLYALEAVIQDIKHRGVDDIYCLGDIVGYGAHPNTCLNIVKRRCSKIVKGNHEDAVCNIQREMELSRFAREGVVFSRKNMESNQIDFLSKLPYMIILEDLDMILCHGSYTEPQAWNYIDSPYAARKELEVTPNRLCFIGHTHNPCVFGSENGLYDYYEDEMELDKNQKYIINVGSVGQPRDGDVRSSYGLIEIDNDSIKLTIVRVFYDIENTERAMKDANISSFLSERLFKGE